MTDSVLYKTEGKIGWITLNRPKVLNAIDKDTLEQLLDIMNQVGADDTIRVLVLTGNERAFSVGGDIKYMMANPTPEAFRTTAHGYQALAQVMRNLEKPIIAAINGHCLGGGLELALMCDLRIAAKSARLGLPDAMLGFSPTGGLTHLLPRVIGLGRAMQLVLLPDPIDAVEAERIGLIMQVVTDETLLETISAIAHRLATFPKHGLAYIKRGIYTAIDANFSATLALEEEVDIACFTNTDTQAALIEFIASRKNK